MRVYVCGCLGRVGRLPLMSQTRTERHMVRYKPDWKSGPHIIWGPVKSSRNVVFGMDHATRGKRISKKTAADLLYQDDDTPGRLTPVQRQTLEDRAGKAYVKRDPFAKRPSETVEQYVARINKLVG